MFGLGFLSLKNAPYIVAGLLLLALCVALGVQHVKISNRDATISDQRADIATLQANSTTQENEIKLFQQGQQAQNATIAALQGQLESQDKDIERFKQRTEDQQAIIARLHSVPAAQKQKTGEVLDDESSAQAVAYLNRIFHDLRLRQ